MYKRQVRSNELFADVLTGDELAEATEPVDGLAYVGSYPEDVFVNMDSSKNEINLVYTLSLIHILQKRCDKECSIDLEVHDIERIRDIVAQGDFIDMETSLPNAEGDPIWCRYQSFVPVSYTHLDERGHDLQLPGANRGHAHSRH